jgi:hypothetical protein
MAAPISDSLTSYFEREKAKMVTNTVTLAKPGSQTYAVGDTELIGVADEGVELARGIEPPTCGLQTAVEPISEPPFTALEATQSHEDWPG